MAGVELSVDQRALTKLAGKLDHEADGKKLRRQLATNLRLAVAPAVKEAKSNILAVRHGGATPPGNGDHSSLAEAIAAGTSASARLSGRYTGVRVTARKKGIPRNFRTAPKRFQQGTFEHPVYGSTTWVVQVGKPEWFDGPMQRCRASARIAVTAAMQDMANRIK